FLLLVSFSFFFQAEDGIRDKLVTGVQTCALPISMMSFVSKLLCAFVVILINAAFVNGIRCEVAKVKCAYRMGCGMALQSYMMERSEERRVGKECRSRWSSEHKKK